MSTKQQLKQRLFEAAEKNAERVFALAEEVLNNPELGYKEYKTSALVRRVFGQAGIAYTEGHALTGVKGVLRSVNDPDKLNVCIIGEMDAVRCSAHPKADGGTGAAHACGHHVQTALMLGCALAFAESGVLDELCGSVTFLAVPAEEFAEIEYRAKLRAEGKISYFGGKQQLIAEGVFDDVDIVMMVHAQADCTRPALFLDGTCLGFIGKTVDFYGRAAHGSMPYEGVNALNAATLALMGIHTVRDTFRDEDRIRIHPIITNGGEIVNSIPDRATVETHVRAANLDAMYAAAKKVDRAVMGAAYTVGAKAEISNSAGYLPMKQDITLGRVLEENAKEYIPAENIRHDVDMFGSTDIGDVSHLLPTVQPMCGGFAGKAHGKDFMLTDAELNLVSMVKILCATTVDLLADGAACGRSIRDAFKPALTKEQYLSYLESSFEVTAGGDLL